MKSSMVKCILSVLHNLVFFVQCWPGIFLVPKFKASCCGVVMQQQVVIKITGLK